LPPKNVPGQLTAPTPTYPILARTLTARRDNLRDTIAALEQRHTTIKATLVELVAA
jgi:hypothetical protein